MRLLQNLLVIFLLSASFPGRAQSDLVERFNNLQKGTELPEELQSSRTAVFVKIDQPTVTDSSTWFTLADVFHESLVALHIDAVAYYRWRDLVAGIDATSSYFQGLAQRGISQIIILEKQNNLYHIYIAPTDPDDPLLLNESNTAWHTSGSTLETAIENMTVTVNRAGLEIANFLISGSPEYFVDTPIFTKNRFESFQPDLKLDKLAVPLFDATDPENLESREDLDLKSIMVSNYPFEYQLVGVNMSEDLMKKAGFHYVLRYLHGEETTLLTLLDYQEVGEPGPGFRFKYYFKHLITGDIYLGDNWDGRASWQEALQVHLQQMKRSLKVE